MGWREPVEAGPLPVFTPNIGIGADLAEEIYGYIGWPASKKKRERQAQIQALRQRS